MPRKNNKPQLEAFFEASASQKQFDEFKSMVMQGLSDLRERIEALEDIVQPDLSTYEPEEEEERKYDEEKEEERNYDEEEQENEEKNELLESDDATSDYGDSSSDSDWYREADPDEI